MHSRNPISNPIAVDPKHSNSKTSPSPTSVIVVTREKYTRSISKKNEVVRICTSDIFLALNKLRNVFVCHNWAVLTLSSSTAMNPSDDASSGQSPGLMTGSSPAPLKTLRVERLMYAKPIEAHWRAVKVRESGASSKVFSSLDHGSKL
ncbi:hypothetical protein TNCV_4256231 [Trichonephila clavipes]|nr:hypothetical protein TNCV_4256231 [Trichonephila clavipes]